MGRVGIDPTKAPATDFTDRSVILSGTSPMRYNIAFRLRCQIGARFQILLVTEAACWWQVVSQPGFRLPLLPLAAKGGTEGGYIPRASQ